MPTQNPKKKIALLVGSLRKASFNRKIAEALISLAPESLSLEILAIGDLPLYNQDLDEGESDDETLTPPDAWTHFRTQLKQADGFLFITPEYNRSVPGVLKNAIDVGSRPYGQSAWEKKPGAVVSVSPGAIGAFGANHHLRQMLVFLDVPCMQQPEAYIGGASEHISEDTRKFLATYLTAFEKWIDLHSALPQKRSDEKAA